MHFDLHIFTPLAKSEPLAVLRLNLVSPKDNRRVCSIKEVVDPITGTLNSKDIRQQVLDGNLQIDQVHNLSRYVEYVLEASGNSAGFRTRMVVHMSQSNMITLSGQRLYFYDPKQAPSIDAYPQIAQSIAIQAEVMESNNLVVHWTPERSESGGASASKRSAVDSSKSAAKNQENLLLQRAINRLIGQLSPWLSDAYWLKAPPRNLLGLLPLIKSTPHVWKKRSDYPAKETMLSGETPLSNLPNGLVVALALDSGATHVIHIPSAEANKMAQKVSGNWRTLGQHMTLDPLWSRGVDAVGYCTLPRAQLHKLWGVKCDIPDFPMLSFKVSEAFIFTPVREKEALLNQGPSTPLSLSSGSSILAYLTQDLASLDGARVFKAHDTKSTDEVHQAIWEQVSLHCAQKETQESAQLEQKSALRARI